MANTLFLRLEGPLQSWGERGQWEVRDTADAPTKSGVVGLLACALGWKTDEELRSLSHQVRLGVRCDRPGTRIMDFHTVGGGYKNSVLLAADGKLKEDKTKGAYTEPTHRHYLCDASFLVAVQCKPNSATALIEQLANAVQNPHWPIYLGRKSCPPGRPVFEDVGTYESLEIALQAKPLRLRQREKLPQYAKVRAVLECDPNDENAVRRRDEIESHTFWRFRPRYARDVEVTVTLEQENDDVSLAPNA
jgi:CRISPR system Cascade subunit CasD